MDNIPAGLIMKFAEFCAAGSNRYSRVALVYDVRTDASEGDQTHDHLPGLPAVAEEAQKLPPKPRSGVVGSPPWGTR